jgi:hypothetical protein
MSRSRLAVAIVDRSSLNGVAEDSWQPVKKKKMVESLAL